MTVDKLESIFQFYRRWMHERMLVPLNYLPGPNSSEPWDFMHLAYMCDEATTGLIPDGKIDKASRWLGFIQGVLVTRKLFTFEEVKSHSRS